MNLAPSSWVLVVSCALSMASALAAPAPPPAGGEAGKEPPRPAKLLGDSLRNLRSQKSLKVQLLFQSGVSDNAEHKINSRRKRYDWRAEVHDHQIMHVPDMKAYRTAQKKGVRYSTKDRRWQNITTDVTFAQNGEEWKELYEAKLLHDVFAFPAAVLSEAVRYSKIAKPSQAGRGGLHGVRTELPAKDALKLYSSLRVPQEGSGPRPPRIFAEAFYEVEIDASTTLPTRIRLTVLAAQQVFVGKSQKIETGEHQVVEFEYLLSEFGQIKELVLPADASALLTKL